MIDSTIYDFNPRPRKLGALTYVCNCAGSLSPSQSLTRMYRVHTTEDGICVLCGHYAQLMEERFIDMDRQPSETTRVHHVAVIERESNGKGQRVQPEVSKEIVRLRKEGYAYHNIGLILGKSTNTVFRHCKKAGL